MEQRKSTKRLKEIPRCQKRLNLSGEQQREAYIQELPNYGHKCQASAENRQETVTGSTHLGMPNCQQNLLVLYFSKEETIFYRFFFLPVTNKQPGLGVQWIAFVF